MNSSAVAQFVANQLATDPKDSKKFLAAFGGGCTLLAIFITSAIIYCINPAQFGNFMGVASIAITTAAGLSATYITGQAAVEFKANAVLQSTQSNQASSPTTVVLPPQPPHCEKPPSQKVDNPDAR